MDGYRTPGVKGLLILIISLLLPNIIWVQAQNNPVAGVAVLQDVTTLQGQKKFYNEINMLGDLLSNNYFTEKEIMASTDAHPLKTKREQYNAELNRLINIVGPAVEGKRIAYISTDDLTKVSAIKEDLKQYWTELESQIFTPNIQKAESDLAALKAKIDAVNVAQYSNPTQQQLVQNFLNQANREYTDGSAQLESYKKLCTETLLPKLKAGTFTEEDFDSISRNYGYISVMNKLSDGNNAIAQIALVGQLGSGNQSPAIDSRSTPEAEPDVGTSEDSTGSTVLGPPAPGGTSTALPSTDTIIGGTSPAAIPPSDTTPSSTVPSGGSSEPAPSSNTPNKWGKNWEWSWKKDSKGNYMYYINGKQVDYAEFQDAGGYIKGKSSTRPTTQGSPKHRGDDRSAREAEHIIRGIFNRMF